MFYGRDLSDVMTGALSLRKLDNLIAHLPANSATHRSVHGPSADWSTGEHLMATIVDLLAWANFQRARGKGTRPKPLKRPGAERRGETHFGGTTLPLDEARARLDRLHGRKARPVTDDEKRALLAELDAAPDAAGRRVVRRRYRIPPRSSAPSHWRRQLGIAPAPRLARR